MASTSPLRLMSTSTEPSRRRVRETEQRVITITVQSDERRVFNVVEAAAILGIGRSKLDELIAAGELRTIHIGRLRKIPVAAIDDFLASRPSTPPSRSGPRLDRPAGRRRGQANRQGVVDPASPPVRDDQPPEPVWRCWDRWAQCAELREALCGSLGS